MSGHWRRVETMPIALDGVIFAAQRYMVVAMKTGQQLLNYGAATYEEAQSISTRLRKTDARIVLIARVDDAWKRQ